MVEEEQHPTDAERREAFEKKLAESREQRASGRGKSKKMWGGILVVLVLLAIGAGFFFTGGSKTTTSSSVVPVELPAAPSDLPLGKEIHWHPTLTLSVCGEEKKLPRETGDMPGIHTHGDMPVMHLELLLNSPSDISLGAAMDSLRIMFDSEHLYDKKNGDACPDGKPGKVKVFVDGKESDKFRDLTLRDGMGVRVEFSS